MKKAIFAAALATCVAGGASATTLIDFTDISKWPTGAETPTILGSTVSVAASPDALTQNPPGPGGVSGGLLAEDTDGLGVNDDEINAPDESITVTFSGAGLNIVGFAFLDLFVAPDLSEREVALVEFDDGTVFTFDAVSAGNGGFAFYSLPGGPKNATSLTFTPASTNDKRADPDYALAAIEVAAIPVPAAGALLLTGLAGVGFLSRRRNKV